MKKIFKQLLVINAVIIMVLSLSACGPKYSPEEDFRVAGSTIIEYTGFDSEVIIPPTIDDVTITAIGEEAFAGIELIPNTFLVSVVIPDTVTEIGIAAFAYCENLKTVDMGSGITTIGKNAFWHCSLLKDVIIPDNVKTIRQGAFGDCIGITSITIPDTITVIDEFTFIRCSNLSSVTIGNSVTSIEQAAFRDCTGLTSVTIPDRVTTIGLSAFMGCTSLTSITIPNSVITIEGAPFQDCTQEGFTITVPWQQGNEPHGFDAVWNVKTWGENHKVIYGSGA